MPDHDPSAELRERLRSLLAEIFEVSPQEINPDLAFGDLPQWDSLGHMDIMMNLESQFGVEITTETIAQLVSLPAICAYLEEQAHA